MNELVMLLINPDHNEKISNISLKKSWKMQITTALIRKKQISIDYTWEQKNN